MLYFLMMLIGKMQKFLGLKSELASEELKFFLNSNNIKIQNLFVVKIPRFLIYFIDEDNKIYSESISVKPNNKNEAISYFKFSEDENIIIYDNEDFSKEVRYYTDITEKELIRRKRNKKFNRIRNKKFERIKESF